VTAWKGETQRVLYDPGTVGGSILIQKASVDDLDEAGSPIASQTAFDVSIPSQVMIALKCILPEDSIRRSLAIENVALGKPTSQSGTLGWSSGAYLASRAVDGNTDGKMHSGSCTHTLQSQPVWWEVDLQDIYRVDTVKIFNRIDCCGARLNGVKVRVGDNECGSIAIPGAASSVSCDQKEGSTVTIYHGRREFLQLCEVEVFGTKRPSIQNCNISEAPLTLTLKRNPHPNPEA